MSSESKLLYFAYGSNMLSKRIKDRVPSAQKREIALLNGYELCWNKKSQDGSGKCHIVQSSSTNSQVCGVIYEILDSDKEGLDRIEGVGKGYEVENVEVLTEQGIVVVRTYIASIIEDKLLPYSWYKQIVLVGARENELPSEYIKQLELVLDKTDSNTNRELKELKILNN